MDFMTQGKVERLAKELNCSSEDIEEMIIDGTLVYMRKHGDLDFLDSLEGLEI